MRFKRYFFDNYYLNLSIFYIDKYLNINKIYFNKIKEENVDEKEIEYCT